MKLSIDWEKPIFFSDQIEEMNTMDLNDFYFSASDIDRLNLFFILEASFHRSVAEGKDNISAKAAYLMAYYLFVTLTPPASCELAEHYIDEALRLNPLPAYEEMKRNISDGN